MNDSARYQNLRSFLSCITIVLALALPQKARAASYIYNIIGSADGLSFDINVAGPTSAAFSGSGSNTSFTEAGFGNFIKFDIRQNSAGATGNGVIIVTHPSTGGILDSVSLRSNFGNHSLSFNGFAVISLGGPLSFSGAITDISIADLNLPSAVEDFEDLFNPGIYSPASSGNADHDYSLNIVSNSVPEPSGVLLLCLGIFPALLSRTISR